MIQVDNYGYFDESGCFIDKVMNILRHFFQIVVGINIVLLWNYTYDVHIFFGRSHSVALKLLVFSFTVKRFQGGMVEA